MREILFKAKRLDNGQWVEGSLHEYINENHFFTNAPIHKAWILKPTTPMDSGWDITDTYRLFEIDPSTICQYTTKTYDQGKKVWDGDIFEVKCNGTETHIEYFTCVVEWHSGFAAFVLKVVGGDHKELYLAFNNTNILSIKCLGNIFDNPELGQPRTS